MDLLEKIIKTIEFIYTYVIFTCLFSKAKYKGVLPHISYEFTSDFYFINNTTNSRYPFLEAQCKPVINISSKS